MTEPVQMTIREIIEKEACFGPMSTLAQRLEDRLHSYINTWASCYASIERGEGCEQAATAIEKLGARLTLHPESARSLKPSPTWEPSIRPWRGPSPDGDAA